MDKKLVVGVIDKLNKNSASIAHFQKWEAAKQQANSSFECIVI